MVFFVFYKDKSRRKGISAIFSCGFMKTASVY